MDTIKTLIAFRDFTIINPERFGGIRQVKRFAKANVYGNASMTCPVVITTKEKGQGYFPRIALVSNPFNINQSFTNLSIEFSIPKLLLNNNIEEVKNSDFQVVIEKLREKLLILSVDVNEEILKKAYVQRIDYSKNFLIKSNIIEFLYNFTKIAIDPRLGGINRDYQRGGTGIKFYTKLYHIIVYDKIAEIENVFKSMVIPKEMLEQIRTHLQGLHDDEKDYYKARIDDLNRRLALAHSKYDRRIDMNLEGSITGDVFVKKTKN